MVIFSCVNCRDNIADVKSPKEEAQALHHSKDAEILDEMD